MVETLEAEASPARLPEPPAPGGGPSSPVDTRRVTLVIPTHNRSHCLRRTVEGVLALELDGREVDLQIVDDGSTDDTPQVVEALRKGYTGPIRIHYHRQEQSGSGAARNRGLAAAETDLVLFLDNDCVPEPDWLRAMVNGPWGGDTGALAGKILSAEQDNWISRFFSFMHYAEGLHLKGNPIPGTLVDYCAGGNCAFLRRALHEVDGFEPMLCGGGVDIDVSRRIRLLDYTLRYQPEAVVRHYHKESLGALVRRFWIHGYRASLYDRLWGNPRPLTPWRVLREWGRLGGWGLRALLLPVDAVRLAARKAAPADALPFAYLAWLRTAAIRCGKCVALTRVYTGRQPLERTRTMPSNRRKADTARPLAGAAAIDRRRATVVIPTLDRPASLRRCLLGVLAEAHGLEVRVSIVDGSRERTAERAVEELRERCPAGVRLDYHSLPGSSAGEARNHGLETAETDLVLFTDDDCVPEPGWIAALVNAPWDGSTGAVGGRVESAAGVRGVGRFCGLTHYNRFPPDNRPLRFVSACNSAYRRRAVLEAGGLDGILEGGPEAAGQDLGRRLMHRGYRLVSEPSAVVRHFPPERLSDFARAAWKRGRSRVLFEARWRPDRGPTWGHLSGAVFRLAGSSLTLLVLPIVAIRTVNEGVPWREAPRAAFLGWFRRNAQRVGEISMMGELLTGRRQPGRGQPGRGQPEAGRDAAVFPGSPGLKSGAVRAKSTSRGHPAD